MARIRTIKPEFWHHELLSALPPETHILAAALLNYTDDEGYFKATPRLVQAACVPLREDTVSARESLVSLHAAGYLSLGEGPDGRLYGHITKFQEHQRINRPSPSKIADTPIVWLDPADARARFTEPSVKAHAPRTQGSFEGDQEGSCEATGDTPGNRAETPEHEPSESNNNPLESSSCIPFTEDSVNVHGGLTEGSPPEGNREGNREGKGSTSGRNATDDRAPDASDAPTVGSDRSGRSDQQESEERPAGGDAGSVVPVETPGQEESSPSAPGQETHTLQPGRQKESRLQPEDDDPVEFTMPTVRAKESDYGIRTSQIAEWVETYPAINVRVELGKAREWLLSNPNKRKTYGGMRRFVTNWLGNAQNKAYTPAPGSKAAGEADIIPAGTSADHGPTIPLNQPGNGGWRPSRQKIALMTLDNLRMNEDTEEVKNARTHP